MPDDDHECIPLYDPAGNLTAVVHGDPNMSTAARAALAEVIEIAQRDMETRPDRDELEARQAAGRERIQERNARLFGDTG